MKLLLALTIFATTAFAQLAITDVSVIPMNRNTVLPHQTVIINGDKITTIGPTKSTKPPQGAQIISGKDKFLIPGLIDAHVHLLSPDQFPLYIANGVTTVFNLDGRPAHLLWRKQVHEGKLLGPTIFTSGPIFFGSRTIETGVKTVDQQADAGYDAFKIFNPVSAEVYPAVVAEAKKRTLLLIGHIPRAVGAETAVASGQSIAHADEFLYTFFNPQHDENPQHIVPDEARIPELARKVRAAGVVVEPTLVTYRDGIEETTNLNQFLATKSELKYLSPWVLDTISPAKNRFKAAYKPADYPLIRQFYLFQQKIVRALFDAGVPLLAGTDATDSGPVAGFGLHDELEELVKCGLSPYEALKTATINPATYLSHAQNTAFGTIEIGKRADLVLLNANPLDKIGNTREAEGVVLRGQWLDAVKLKAMLDRQAEIYKKEAAAFTQDVQSDPKQAAAFAAENDPFHGMTDFLIEALIENQQPDAFSTLVAGIREKDPESPLITEAAINRLGYFLLQGNKMRESLIVFKVNTQEYPKSANAFDSWGEAQFKNGSTADAVASYRRALELDPNYVNAEFAKKFVEEHSKELSSRTLKKKRYRAAS